LHATLFSPTVLRRLAQFALAWFVLSLGVAVASPWVNPSAAQWVCSANGVMKWVDVSALSGATEGTQADAAQRVGMAHSLDCPLCTVVGAPPAALAMAVAPPPPLSYALQPIAAAHIAARIGAPLPARGPPQAF
jgi:Protein of unknown function (DUF2946)